ncbi:hypothetical protein, unknown function [Leishmania tarentolae]|uniref:Uncharacterized protein n=1 Tax=Leishmania tarentolae TaxID=5689 RepID=A0A640L126_LEITA|nr:hypothetical protein, unknown function [Leishmania tarentolae]
MTLKQGQAKGTRNNHCGCQNPLALAYSDASLSRYHLVFFAENLLNLFLYAFSPRRLYLREGRWLKRSALATPELLGEGSDNGANGIPHQCNHLKNKGSVELVARALEHDGGEVGFLAHVRAELLAVRTTANGDEEKLAECGQKEEDEQRQLDLQAAEALQAGHEKGVKAKDSSANCEGLHGTEGSAKIFAAGEVDADWRRSRHICCILARHGDCTHHHGPQRHNHLSILVVV